MSVAVTKPLLGWITVSSIPWILQFAAIALLAGPGGSDVHGINILIPALLLVVICVLHCISIAMSCTNIYGQEWLYLIPLAISLAHVCFLYASIVASPIHYT
jgi:hypothetical protein